jgi:hypothetical protein
MELGKIMQSNPYIGIQITHKLYLNYTPQPS